MDAYEIVFKRYAPFEWFGGGFHGDTRVAPSLEGTARTWGVVSFTFDETANDIMASSRSGVSYHRLKPSWRKIGTTDIVLSGEGKSGGWVRFSVHTAGALPLIPGSPDIDTFVDITLKRAGSGDIHVSGRVTGDSFPNFEMFLVNKTSGRHALVADFRTKGDATTGPVRRLPGAHLNNVLIPHFAKTVTI